MKLIIDIDKEKYNQIINSYQGSNVRPKDYEIAIINGTPIPDNATNGDVIIAMFPNGVTAKFATFMRFVVGEDEYINCTYDWWNSPYQKGGK